jgi:hypothetical protein
MMGELGVMSGSFYALKAEAAGFSETLVNIYRICQKSVIKKKSVHVEDESLAVLLCPREDQPEPL